MKTGLDFTGLMAGHIHEFKNWLAELTLLLDELAVDTPGVAGGRLDTARFLCGRIRDRMVQLLTLYKLDGGDHAFTWEAHNPADVIEDCAAELAALTGRRLVIAVHVHPDTPAFWFFDRELARGALINAGHNALSHAKERVILSVAPQDGMLAFSVADDGPGYPREILAADLSRPQPGTRGTGLGLFFAHAIAKAHEHQGRHGRVVLANRDGAVFTLVLP